MKIPVVIAQDPYQIKKAVGKTTIYVDGQNFLHRCTERLTKIGVLTRDEKLIDIDLNTMFRKIFPKDSFEIRFYGVSRIRRPSGYDENLLKKAQGFTDTLRRIRSSLTAQGVILRDVGQLRVRNTDKCMKCGYEDYKFQEKGVDVGLATDMVRDVLLGETAKAILVSSDIDMLPAVKIVRGAGVKLVYVGFDGSINNALANNADDVFRIHNLGVLEAYEAALNSKKVVKITP